MIEIAEYSSNQNSLELHNTGLDISKVLNCNPFTSFLKLVTSFLHELKFLFIKQIRNFYRFTDMDIKNWLKLVFKHFLEEYLLGYFCFV